MIRDFKKARKNMNDILKTLDSSAGTLLVASESIINSIKASFKLDSDAEKRSSIYAYVPLVTALCPSELGTSSDYSCRRPGGEANDNEPQQVDIDKPVTPEVPVMGRGMLNSWYGLSYAGVNPF